MVVAVHENSRSVAGSARQANEDLSDVGRVSDGYGVVGDGGICGAGGVGDMGLAIAGAAISGGAGDFSGAGVDAV